MNKIMLGVVGLVALALAGCSTTKGTTASLENRVQVLEGRVQVLEGDVQSQSMTGSESMSSSSSSGATAETMTKKQIQEALKNAGYYDGTVDGKIGPRSKEAIKDFQRDNGLKVDGVAGRNTKEKLIKYLQ